MFMIQAYFIGTDVELWEHNLQQQADLWQGGIFHLLS